MITPNRERKVSDLEWIRQSNLIEGVDSILEDKRSMRAWTALKKRRWSLETVLWLHKRIMWTQWCAIAGKIRTCNVRVGDKVCPPYQEIQELLAAYCKRISLQNWSWEQIKADHVEFERIHPFRDGNGRTGRMLMNWQRINTGMQPLLIRADDRWQYYEWFKEQPPKETP